MGRSINTTVCFHQSTPCHATCYLSITCSKTMQKRDNELHYTDSVKMLIASLQLLCVYMCVQCIMYVCKSSSTCTMIKDCAEFQLFLIRGKEITVSVSIKNCEISRSRCLSKCPMPSRCQGWQEVMMLHTIIFISHTWHVLIPLHILDIDECSGSSTWSCSYGSTENVGMEASAGCMRTTCSSTIYVLHEILTIYGIIQDSYF